MAEKVDQVTLGIGQGISAEELAASVHNCSIDELRAARAFAAGRQQGLREAVEVASGLEDKYDAHWRTHSDMHDQGKGDGAGEVRAAITALIEGEGNA